ncbi:MarR family winged helix-turn-helix transcriptional regulator [Micromonospora sp. NBC_01813]|uniref:MarR family winged helix-turn-helix transcriptional regulator n=1 Tax=Micromonospora sp. NBC_01813 TaxID=2975988 RepID=UPI002DDA3240|nr:MarR family transcriptional regulator [Micromonospora sp. NBC_01813]WSA12478.1 MarR family transcriptional regulator [Micromonospora sp. NBC_01813]
MWGPRPSGRQAVVSEIIRRLRGYTVEAGHVGHAFAALHDLHATDLQALIAVMDAEQSGDPITPGVLATQLNLTSSSVTALVDRLERAGHLHRDRDASDRRKVRLRYAAGGAELAREFFAPLGRRTDAVMAGFTDDELETVRRFLVAMGDSTRAHRDEVRAAARTVVRPGPVPVLPADGAAG